MPAPPVFSDSDLEGLRRAKAWLGRMPRLRVMTPFSRTLVRTTTRIAILALRPAIRRSGLLIENRTVSALGRTVRVRILRPEGALRGVHLDMHGGAWCAGSAEMDDRTNTALARACDVAVVSVDYRLAPNHPISAIIDDCETAAAWLFAHARQEFGVDAVTIGGESAGAHLAACTLLRRPGPFRAALLYYGLYDLSGSEAFRCAPEDVLIFHRPSMLPSLRRLTPGMTDEERRDPAISPGFAEASGLPPVLIVAGADDPLSLESVALHARWQAANGNADLLMVPEAPHAFNRLTIPLAHKTEAYVHAWLNAHLSAASQ